MTTPFQSPYLPSPWQPLCSAPIRSLHTHIPAFLLLILPHQPFSNASSGCIHTHTLWLPLPFPLQSSTPPSSQLWPISLHTFSSALLTPPKPFHFCFFPSFLLFGSRSKSCSFRDLSSSSWCSSSWLPSHSPSVSQASAEEMPNFYIVILKKKTYKTNNNMF